MISIIIPNLHSPIVDQVILALERQTARDQIAEIIVVGQDRYGRVPPQLRSITTPRPVPAAVARNLGARAATSDYLLFLDADCIAAPDLVAQMLTRHREGETVVGGSVLLERGAYWVVCDNLLTFARHLSISAAGERRYLPSMTMSIRRDLFLDLGGFDERFAGAAGEDLDFSLRLRDRGQRLVFEPQAVVRHCPPRASAGKVWQHLRSFGRVHLAVQRRYGTRAAPRLSLRMRPWSGLIIAAAPLLALADALALLGTNPALRSFWWAMPGLVWGKTAWYWGLAEALMAGGSGDAELNRRCEPTAFAPAQASDPSRRS